MVAHIPNDIFQFSLPAAIGDPTSPAGPTPANLSGYGNHGVGILASGLPLAFIDDVAWSFDAANSLTRAPSDAAISFVQMTKFVAEHRSWTGFRNGVNSCADASWLLEHVYAKGAGDSGGANSFMPFLIRGDFREVKMARGKKAVGEEEQEDFCLNGCQGTIVGVFSPTWAAGISVAGVNCYYLSNQTEEQMRAGGRVLAFEATDEKSLLFEWAVTGRFHLGMPKGAEWEALKL
ncbi:hypothetical protein BU16DRAFT_52318 [Lophium mytilinum]|uniref:Alpha-acetolactate decarboxylase n=1 Tax=Lophium mytilinum TaxID=390894 RepID=A0A6A6QNJ6_9PEZI|nr:hypothetical protein BU16DRAFT_52318 [Lophium mytilinum]